MRYKLLVLMLILLVATAYAKEPKAYQSGKLLQMDSVKCGMDEKDAKSFAGEMIGTDSGIRRHKNFFARSICFRPTRWSIESVPRTKSILHFCR